MSRYFPDKKDSTGWQRGAGAYSKSYPKVSTSTPKGMRGYFPKPTPSAVAQGNTGSSSVGAVPRVQDLIRGTDVSSRVFPVGNRNYGLSAPVSAGKRPAHKAQSSAGGSGVDRPDTPKWRKFKDWS
jgi:hypothetical protein